MAIRATHVPTGTDITIGPFIDASSRAIIDEVYQNCSAGVLECREHDDDPRLAYARDEDGRVHGAWVHIKQNPAKTKWVIAHSAKGIAREFRSHETPIGKSDQHQWQQDYISRAAEDVGFPTEQEVILASGARLDVKIDGAVGPVGFEVQHSFLSVPKVRRRTSKANKEGIPLVWSADHKGPAWAFKVPHIEANGCPDGSTPRRAWTVTTGPRQILPIECSLKNADLLPGCQRPRRRNWCGSWHPVFRPIAGLVVDDIAQQVPSGELVPLNTRTKQGVILVSAAHYDLWQHEFATQVEADLNRIRNNARRCNYRPRIESPLADLEQTCTGCGQSLPLRQPGRVVCKRCRAAELSADVWRWLAPGYDH